MDSHIDTADPWAAAVEEAEVSTSAAEETPLDRAVEPEDSTETEQPSDQDEPSKGGLFGRRKGKNDRSEAGIDGGFSLMSPAPVAMSDDPQFEVVDSEALEIAPDLGLSDNVGDAVDEDSEPLLAAPMDDELYPPLEAVGEDGGLGSISSLLNPSSFSRADAIDFDSVSEEIANAVEEAQPAGIFGALSNPGTMLKTAQNDGPDEESSRKLPEIESIEDLIEKTEDSLDDLMTDTDDSFEQFVDESHESLADVLDAPENVTGDAAQEDSLDESVESLIAEIGANEAPLDESDASEEDGFSSPDPHTKDEEVVVQAELLDTSGGIEEVVAKTAPEPDVSFVVAEELQEEDVEIPADPFAESPDSEDDPSDLTVEKPVVQPSPGEAPDTDLPTDHTDESTQVAVSVDTATEEEPDMEPRRIESVSESSFSLTNAPAEPLDGDEGLFVSAGTEEEVQPVVLVTTDTVPGMEMGDSCGLVTAVQAAKDATVLSVAIAKAHSDLSDRASEVGATAVISVTTAINEVQAGFLVVASGTAVLAAS